MSPIVDCRREDETPAVAVAEDGVLGLTVSVAVSRVDEPETEEEDMGDGDDLEKSWNIISSIVFRVRMCCLRNLGALYAEFSPLIT